MKYKVAAVLLCFLGSIKVIADALELKALSAVVAVTNTTPAMKVFTAHDGYETYSAKFQLQVDYDDGSSQSSVLTKQQYQGLRGPYNRRNVYGALIAYGPILYSSEVTHKMWVTMSRNAFCRNEPISEELGYTSNAKITSVSITYFNQTKTDEYPDKLVVSCDV